jgi:peroxisomal enoyl-CoA hydratase 2
MSEVKIDDYFKEWKDVEAVPVSYNQRDLILYALGIGSSDLKFVYENHSDFAMFPTYPIVLGFKGTSSDVLSFPSPPMMASNVLPPLPGARAFLDGERYFELIKPLPSQGGEFMLKTRLVGVFKKGSGAAAESESLITDAKGEVYVRMCSSAFCVGAKDFKDAGVSNSENVKLPTRTPDQVAEMKTSPHQTHIYRLSGDYNPLHVDPDSASMMGFQAPILHGLCSLGFTARAVLSAFGDNDATRFGAMRVRFASPVIPGDTLVVSMWKEGPRVICEVRVKETNKVVLSNCYVVLKGAAPASKL